MEDRFGHMDNLISGYFANEAKPEERALLEAWINESEEHRVYFEESRKIFEFMSSANPNPDVDVNAAWQKLDARISNSGGAKVIPLWQRLSPLKIAASVMLIITLGFIANWLINGGSEPQVILAENATKEQKLPDGSTVFLNKNTEISYEIKGNKRQVKLKGEAFFEVVHNEAQPFEIEVNGVIIKDIGTAFNVKALPESNLIEVFVESGEVQFFTQGSEGLNLVKGEKALYDKNTGKFSKIVLTSPDNTTSYRSKVFHFSNTSLKEAIELINEVYQSDLRLADETMGNCRLSVEFNNEEIDLIVSVIAETLDLQVENKSGAVILKGGACPE